MQTDAKSQNGALPLAGVTVLEMGTFITGPCAGMLLADYVDRSCG